MTSGVECSMCGRCCQWIWTDPDFASQYWTTSDPRVDEEWAKWVEKGWDDATRERTIENWRSTIFIADHWITAGKDSDHAWRFNCDQFDPKTRLCMAHDDRPPICSGYPWYGRAPSAEVAERNLPSCCSFHADVLTGTLVSIGAPPQ